MARTASINTRIEPSLKEKAEGIFSRLGLSPSSAITLFYQQVVYRRGIPFDVCIPNAETVAALQEAERGEGDVVVSSTADAFADILGADNNRR